MTLALAIVAVGFIAGLLAGLFGVGGGALFVPALVLLAHAKQIDAEGTALLAIIPVALVGVWRQQRYGNVRLKDGLLIGVLGIGGSAAGVIAAQAASERALRVAFAILLLVIAAQLLLRLFKGAQLPDSEL